MIIYNKTSQVEGGTSTGSNHHDCLREQRIMASAKIDAPSRTVKRFQEESVWSSGKFTVDSECRVWFGEKRAERATKRGYLQVRVMVNGTRYYTCAHRLVWRALVGPIPTGLVINHKNGCKNDNRPSNLEVVTPSENTTHAYKTGLRDEHGEKNPASKLTDRDVAQIRNMYAQGGYTMERLGEMFGVRFQHISRLVRGERRPKQGGPVAKEDLRHIASERDGATGRFVPSRQ
jgi:hypothetical protein